MLRRPLDELDGAGACRAGGSASTPLRRHEAAGITAGWRQPDQQRQPDRHRLQVPVPVRVRRAQRPLLGRIPLLLLDDPRHRRPTDVDDMEICNLLHAQ